MQKQIQKKPTIGLLTVPHTLIWPTFPFGATKLIGYSEHDLCLHNAIGTAFGSSNTITRFTSAPHGLHP